MEHNKKSEKAPAVLKEIATRHDVRILWAVESGSRAWGFASRDSDYDIRFIYAHPRDWYLSVNEGKDTIEVMDMENDLDFAGWDVRKALRLFAKSNPPLLEWLDSPLVYMQDGELRTGMRALRDQIFRPQAGIYHYIAMAKRNWNEYLLGRETVRLKKYLYVIRPLLACMYIERTGEMAPMEIEVLMNELPPRGPLLVDIIALLGRKRYEHELGEGPPEPLIDAWIKERMEHYRLHPPAYDPRQRPSYDQLDQLFRQTLDEVDYSQLSPPWTVIH